MVNVLLSSKIQEFINKNITADISKLALKKNPFPEIDYSEILNQIISKNKAKEKLPTWFEKNNIIYPSTISIEQTSSEKTAQYKSGLVSGQSLVDLTGGFGVDDFYFAKKLATVFHCELNTALSEIVKHNFTILKANNIFCLQGDSLKSLKKLNQNFDWIYIDPSRRSNTKGKVFMLKDCLPNVPEFLNVYLQFSENILIKTAPILDISLAVSELKFVKEIHIIAVNNEVKELLFVLENNYRNKISIKTINISNHKNELFNFIWNEKHHSKTYSLPENYLYEPNAAILKSGAFEVILAMFTVKKLHKHSHLYTSNEIIEFPGRIFKIEKTFEYNKSYMTTFLKNTKANITTRNFPETVENIRKKWNINDGGNVYVFFTTNANNIKTTIICSKI